MGEGNGAQRLGLTYEPKKRILAAPYLWLVSHGKEKGDA